jgi:hypothetical protein
VGVVTQRDKQAHDPRILKLQIVFALSNGALKGKPQAPGFLFDKKELGDSMSRNSERIFRSLLRG